MGLEITPGGVQSVSVVTANGFSGSVATSTTTPAITLNNPTALVVTTSVTAPFFVSAAGNPADAGAIRLGSTEIIAWEAATPGTDLTLGVNSSDVLASTAAFSAPNVTSAGLTAGRVTFAGTAGLLSDSANLQWTSPTVMIAGATTAGPDVEVKITGDTFSRVAMGINTADVARLGFGPGSGARDAFLEYVGAGNIKQGGTDSATPVAQIHSVQNVITGTSNTAGADLTFKASQGTGTQTSGRQIFQIGIAGSTGTTVNALENKFIIGPTGVTVSVGETTSALTDLLINPTTKASGNLWDAQVNGVSQGKLSSSGGMTITSGITIGAGSGLFATGRGGVYSPTTDGIWTFVNNGFNGWTRLNFGGDTNSFSGIGRDAVNGFTLQSAAGTATWNDASTAGSGTVANRYLFGINSSAPALTATNSSVTYTVASTLYVPGAPTASTNVTIGTAWALLVASGNVSFSGSGPKLSDAAFTTCAGLSTTANVIGCVVSDATLKQDFHNYSDGLEFIRSVNAETYSFKKGSQWYDGGRTRLGLVAQEVAKRLPMAVYPIGPEQPLQIDQGAVIAAELDAIKQLDLKIQVLDLKTQILDERINTLRKLINH